MLHSFKAMFNGGTRKRVAAAAAAAGIALPVPAGQPRSHPPRPNTTPPPTPLGLLQSPAPSSRHQHPAPEKRLKSDSREKKSSSSMSATPTSLPYIPRFHSIESLAASSANSRVEKVIHQNLRCLIIRHTKSIHDNYLSQIVGQLSPPPAGAPFVEGMWGAQPHGKFGGGCFPWNPFAAAAAYPLLWGQEQRHHFRARTTFHCSEGKNTKNAFEKCLHGRLTAQANVGMHTLTNPRLLKPR